MALTDDRPFGEDFSWPLWPVSADCPPSVRTVGFRVEDAGVAVADRVLTAVAEPFCLGFLPERPNGRAVLVLAGGGYTQLMIGKEGVEVAHWLTGLGFHAFVLAHRFPSAVHASQGRPGAQAPVDDAIEAMQRIRASAAELGLDPAGVGALGLSSGGHLAACLVAAYPADWSAPPSPHAAWPSRPDFLIVGYGPISTNAAGRTVIADKPPLPPPEKQALYDALQPDAQLIDGPPPTFIVYAASDPVVPVENARRLHAALEAKGGLAELHIFAQAPHGFALRQPALPVGAWPALCEAWLRQGGFLG